MRVIKNFNPKTMDDKDITQMIIKSNCNINESIRLLKQNKYSLVATMMYDKSVIASEYYRDLREKRRMQHERNKRVQGNQCRNGI